MEVLHGSSDDGPSGVRNTDDLTTKLEFLTATVASQAETIASQALLLQAFETAFTTRLTALEVITVTPNPENMCFLLIVLAMCMCRATD